jgi:hypothetical protein
MLTRTWATCLGCEEFTDQVGPTPVRAVSSGNFNDLDRFPRQRGGKQFRHPEQRIFPILDSPRVVSGAARRCGVRRWLARGRALGTQPEPGAAESGAGRRLGDRLRDRCATPGPRAHGAHHPSRPNSAQLGAAPRLVEPTRYFGVNLGVTRSWYIALVPALSLKLVARRHVDYGRTRSMICMSA